MKLALATALLVAGCHAPAPAPTTADPHGRVVRTSFHSDALGVDKAYLVYLPAGYDAAPATRWPVLYYFTGLGGVETDWVDNLHLDVAADRIGLGAIIVMPDGDAGFFIDARDAPGRPDYDACMRDGSGLFDPTQQPYAAQCVRHRAYETYIVKDLIAHVDATYRTIARRDGRGLAGLSMGGFGAWSLAMRHPDLFAAAASHSGVVAALYAGPHPYVSGPASWITDAAEVSTYYGADIGAWVIGILGTDLANWRAHDPATLIDQLAPGTIALYLDCGTEDDFRLNDEAAWMDASLTAHHIQHAYFSGPGGHDAKFWEPRGVVSLTFLRDHLASAAPR